MVPIHKIGGRLGNRMFQLAYVYAQSLRGEVPDIWVQYPELFDEFRPQIQKLYGDGVLPSRFVSIHVRRGDYVADDAFVNLFDTDYYERAIEMFPDAKFRVFSDDTDWCKRKWKDRDRFQVSEGRSEIDDFNLMAGCRHNIIANSSFSWWAAYVNPNPEKIVVYPKAWHSDGVKRVGFPEGWLCL